MHAGSSKIDVAFVAAHLLTPTLVSGGDVLFAHIAREAAMLRPDWRFAVIAPEVACDGLSPFFKTVVPLPCESKKDGEPATHPLEIAARWARRMRPCAQAALQCAPRLLHATGDFFVDVLPPAWTKRRLGARFTTIVHHLNAPPHRRHNAFVVAAGSWVLQRISLAALRAGADHIFLVNRQTESALLRSGFHATKLTVTGAGIDIARFPLAAPPPQSRRVLWVHRLEPTKGIFDLPRLASLLLPGTRVDVVGRGPKAWRERLEAELRRAGADDRVVLHEYVDDDTLGRLYAEANVFVSCSYEEGWGISLAEALAVGVPCVAYALPSYTEVFGDAVETVPVGDVDAMARRVNGILSATDAPMARARRRAAVERYSFSSLARRTVDVFAALLDDPLTRSTTTGRCAPETFR